MMILTNALYLTGLQLTLIGSFFFYLSHKRNALCLLDTGGLHFSISNMQEGHLSYSICVFLL